MFFNKAKKHSLKQNIMQLKNPLLFERADGSPTVSLDLGGGNRKIFEYTPDLKLFSQPLQSFLKTALTIQDFSILPLAASIYLSQAILPNLTLNKQELLKKFTPKFRS